MSKVKITVLKTTLDKELAREYGAEGLTACPLMKEGPSWICPALSPLRILKNRKSRRKISKQQKTNQ